jgi:hypothetical protein
MCPTHKYHTVPPEIMLVDNLSKAEQTPCPQDIFTAGIFIARILTI